jgi:hypothetical protein
MKTTALTLTIIAGLLITLVLIASVPSLKAVTQAPQVQWQQFLPGVFGKSVIQTPEGAYLALGVNATLQDESFYLNQESFLVKTDSSGNLLWKKTFQVEGLSPELSSIIKTADGNYAIAGSLEGKICLIKIDSNGNVLWTKTWLGYNYSNPEVDGFGTIGSFIQTSDKGYAFVTGYSYRMYIQEIWFVKVDSTGNLQLNRTISTPNSAYPVSIVETTDEGYVILGEFPGRGGGSKYGVIKIDSNGNTQWQKSYGLPSSISSYATCGIATSDGGYLLGGETIINNFKHGLLVKTDSQGNVLWNKTTTQNSTIRSIVQTSDGGYIFVGVLGDYGQVSINSKFFTWVAKIDRLGDIEWELTFEIEIADSINYPTSIVQTIDEGYVFVGQLHQKFWLVKIAPTSIPTSSPSTTPTPSQEPTSTTEPFPITLVLASVITVVVVGIGLLVYLKKRKN